ncbi:MAG: NAD(P)H-dependent oxidoreductase [Flavobacteriaceae bacterium]
MMNTLLRIDSSFRIQNSISRKVGDYFIHEWGKQNPNGKIITRDLAQNPIPHLDHSTWKGFYDSHSPTDLLKRSDVLIEELYQCDEILITNPMYNFGLPSSLKSYFDVIVRSEKTFRYTDEQEGLLTNKTVFAITAMGDRNEPLDSLSLSETHLQNILNYIGIENINYFLIDGTSDKEYAVEIMAKQQKRITDILRTPAPVKN